MQRVTDGVIESAAFLAALLLFVLGIRHVNKPSGRWRGALSTGVAFFLSVFVQGCKADKGMPKTAIDAQSTKESGHAALELPSELNTPEKWAAFKAFWKRLDNPDGIQTRDQVNAYRTELEQILGRHYILRTLSQQQKFIYGIARPVTPESPALSIESYCLFVLSEFRIAQLRIKEELEILSNSRMMMPRRLDLDESLVSNPGRLVVQIDSLIRLRRQAKISESELLINLDRMPSDAFYNTVLAKTAKAHFLFHKVKSTSMPMNQDGLLSFYLHPYYSTLGTDAWMQEYEQAFARALQVAGKSANVEEKQQIEALKGQQDSLKAALKRLKEYEPKLEALFADLEK